MTTTILGYNTGSECWVYGYWQHSIRFSRVPAVARHCRQLAIILKSGDYFFQKAIKNAVKSYKIFDVAIKICIWLQLWLLIAIFQLEPWNRIIGTYVRGCLFRRALEMRDLKSTL